MYEVLVWFIEVGIIVECALVETDILKVVDVVLGFPPIFF